MKLGSRVSQHNFAMIPSASVARSSFDRSFQRKQTFNADYLVPIFLDEVLPGDTFNLRLTSFGRLSTPIVPIMDNLYLDYFFFFVPNRLVWNNWEKFNGAQDNPGDSTDFVIPQAEATELVVATNSLQNYMGLHATNGSIHLNNKNISALPFRCYNLCWNEWFRDQNLQDSVVVDKDDGPDSQADYVLLKRGKRHDYFTSCLPWPQKGPSIEIPLGTSVPIVTNNTAPIFTGTDINNSLAVVGDDHVQISNPMATTQNLKFGSESGLVGDLANSVAGTINELREAFQIQRMYERDARGGTRYIEIIKSHFGVVSPDARLQRPEYLGGGQARVNISPIAQTSSTDATTPQGNLAAFGTVIANGIGFQKSFVEHGYILGLVSARADISYQTGINKLWSRSTRFDFYWPSLAHLGEQAVLGQEIYMENGAYDTAVFGYQERYAEYRYKPSEILGLFESGVSGSLDIWQLAEDFGSVAGPTLDSDFIQSSTPIGRCLAVPTEPHFLWDGYFNLICARPMPSYSIPGFVDHF